MSGGNGQLLVERPALLEACAGLHAAIDLLARLAGGLDVGLAEPFYGPEVDLRRAAFGDPPEEDEAYENDPILLEIEKRADQIVARALHEYGIGDDDMERGRLPAFLPASFGAYKAGSEELARRIGPMNWYLP